MVIDALNGAWTGHSFNRFKRSEESYRAGVSRFDTALDQIACVDNTLFQASAALNYAGAIDGKFPLLIKRICYLTPVITNYACSCFNLKESPTLKKLANFVNDQLITLCQVAIITSSVALIVLGQTWMGGLTLSFLTFEIMGRFFAIPPFATRSVNTIGFFVTNFARFFVGDFFNMAIGALDITSYFYDYFSKKNKAEPFKANLQPIAIRVNQAGFLGVMKVSPLHLRFSHELPIPPDVDLSVISEAFEEVDWKKNEWFDLLKKKVEQDDHWKEKFGDKSTDREIFEYVQSGVKSFVRNLQERKLPKGEFFSYDSIVTKAKFIANELKNLNEREQIVYLVDIGLASRYCPGGYARVINELYMGITDRVEEQSLPFLVNKVFESMRHRLLEQFLVSEVQTHYPKCFLDVTNIHDYNLLKNVLGELFHCSNAHEESEDSLSFISTWRKILLQKLFRTFVAEFIATKYNPDMILAEVKEAIYNQQIPYALLKDFFVDEYMFAQNVKKNAAQQWVCRNAFKSYDGSINSPFLKFLLARVGVLAVSG